MNAHSIEQSNRALRLQPTPTRPHAFTSLHFPRRRYAAAFPPIRRYVSAEEAKRDASLTSQGTPFCACGEKHPVLRVGAAEGTKPDAATTSPRLYPATFPPAPIGFPQRPLTTSHLSASISPQIYELVLRGRRAAPRSCRRNSTGNSRTLREPSSGPLQFGAKGMSGWKPFGEMFNRASVHCHECKRQVDQESAIRYRDLLHLPKMQNLVFPEGSRRIGQRRSSALLRILDPVLCQAVGRIVPIGRHGSVIGDQSGDHLPDLSASGPGPAWQDSKTPPS